MAKPRKQQLEDEGMVEIRLIVTKEVERYVREFAKQLTTGAIEIGQTIKIA